MGELESVPLVVLYYIIGLISGNMEIYFIFPLRGKPQKEELTYTMYYKSLRKEAAVRARSRVMSNTYKEASSRKRGERTQQSWVKIRRVRKDQLFLFLQGSQTL